jgi:hypothetical protein
MKSPLTYYHDEKLTKKVQVNEEGNPILDWGETIPGKLVEKTLYVKNESKDKLVIRQPFSTNEDLTIKDYPSRLFGEEAGAVKFSFKPNPEKIEAHNSSWGFEVVIG